MKISAKSNVNKVAGALALSLEEQGTMDIQAIGPQAINQMVKGIAVAKSLLAYKDLSLVCAPSFLIIDIEPGVERTAIKFEIKLTNL